MVTTKTATPPPSRCEAESIEVPLVLTGSDATDEAGPASRHDKETAVATDDISCTGVSSSSTTTTTTDAGPDAREAACPLKAPDDDNGPEREQTKPSGDGGGEDGRDGRQGEDYGRDGPLFQFLTGMGDDLRARAPFYRDDWGKPRDTCKVVNATIFTFVIQLIPALIFAELMDRQTEGNLGVAETVVSSAIMGVIYGIFAGQVRGRKYAALLWLMVPGDRRRVHGRHFPAT